MSIDPDLLEILACPLCKEGVEVVELPEETIKELVEKYQPKFRDEVPVVSEGLKCTKCSKVYPIVSDIPVMLIEDALNL